ncbi:MAG TPA: hypothetical protein V6C72_11780 [Chroococcales cyanobacterium]
MKKPLLTLLVLATVSSTLPAFCQSSTASDSKLKTAAQAVGRGIMWGPRKIGAGLKKMGEGTKNLFHRG